MGEHRRPKFGATGKFPHGKITPQDEGELNFGIGRDKHYIHINFGKPVIWFSMTPEDALKVASSIVEHAMAIKRGQN
jgi:hypothetical protein